MRVIKKIATGSDVALKKILLYGGLTSVEYLDNLHYQISPERFT